MYSFLSSKIDAGLSVPILLIHRQFTTTNIKWQQPNTKLTKVFSRGYPGGELCGTPVGKPPFHLNLVINSTLYIYTLKTTIFKQTKMTIQNGG